MNRKLPLTARNRLTKVLAAIRNHERFTHARIVLILTVYSSYMKECAADGIGKNGQEISKAIKKYRPALAKHITAL